MKYVFAALLFAVSLFGADYDCVFIGSSPISLFEALYQHVSGKEVLIVDESPIFGGAAMASLRGGILSEISALAKLAIV